MKVAVTDTAARFLNYNRVGVANSVCPENSRVSCLFAKSVSFAKRGLG